jgi:hypothetical protein
MLVVLLKKCIKKLIYKTYNKENKQEQIVSMPRIGDEAPKFKAITIQGDLNFPANYVGE